MRSFTSFEKDNYWQAEIVNGTESCDGYLNWVADKYSPESDILEIPRTTAQTTWGNIPLSTQPHKFIAQVATHNVE